MPQATRLVTVGNRDLPLGSPAVPRDLPSPDTHNPPPPYARHTSGYIFVRDKAHHMSVIDLNSKTSPDPRKNTGEENPSMNTPATRQMPGRAPGAAAAPCTKRAASTGRAPTQGLHSRRSLFLAKVIQQTTQLLSVLPSRAPQELFQGTEKKNASMVFT